MKGIPEPLQKQVLCRTGCGALALLMCVIMLFWTKDLYSVLACIVLFLFFVASAYLLLRRCSLGNYMVLSGACIDVILTPVRKRTKAIQLKTEEHTVQVMVRHRRRKIPVGACIDLYISPTETVDERDGIHRIYHYLALEIKRSVTDNGKSEA